jgi:hypothetical protein
VRRERIEAVIEVLEKKHAGRMTRVKASWMLKMIEDQHKDEMCVWLPERSFDFWNAAPLR